MPLWIPPEGSHPGYVAGRWYQTHRGTIAAGAAFAGGSIRLVPFILPKPIKISDLGVRITTGASGGNCQLAIYGSDQATKLPTGNALASTGSISTTNTGVVSADITGSDVSLVPGLLWTAINLDATAASTAVFQVLAGAHDEGGWLIGSTTQANISGSATVGALVLSFAQTYNTWPDLTGQSLSVVAANSYAILHMKAA